MARGSQRRGAQCSPTGCIGLRPALWLLSGAARNFIREGPVTDVVRFHTLAFLHKDHFDGQFLVYYNRM